MCGFEFSDRPAFDFSTGARTASWPLSGRFDRPVAVQVGQTRANQFPEDVAVRVGQFFQVKAGSAKSVLSESRENRAEVGVPRHDVDRKTGLARIESGSTGES